MDPKLAEVIERVAGKIVTGIVIAGALGALAIYARPGPPRYQAMVSGNVVIRLNTDSGSMIACNLERCFTLYRPGNHIGRHAPIEIPAKAPAAASPAARP